MQFNCIAIGKASAVIAQNGELIIGFAAILFGDACPTSLAKYDDLKAAAYIGDVVVHSDYSGKGLAHSYSKVQLNSHQLKK
ncbi:GNAT family N-acetyltransferase [Pseudoalteromonas byunsanensis]|nr:GNAT family N-acetyltransferase [Pseudoalteromonas byunsanensis]